MTKLQNGAGLATLAALLTGIGTILYGAPQAQAAPTLPLQTANIFNPDPAKFDACGTWKQTHGTGEEQKDVVWQVSRLGFAHGIAYGLQADPLGAYSTMVHPSLKAEKDPWLPLGDLDANYVKGLQAVIGRPAVLLEAFDDLCKDYKNERVPTISLTLIAILNIGGLPQGRVENALVPLRAGGDGAWAAMMAALKAKDKK